MVCERGERQAGIDLCDEEEEGVGAWVVQVAEDDDDWARA